MSEQELSIKDILYYAKEVEKILLQIESVCSKLKIDDIIDFNRYKHDNIPCLPKMIDYAKDEIINFYNQTMKELIPYNKLRIKISHFKVELEYSKIFVSIMDGDIRFEVTIKHLDDIIDEYKNS